VFLSPPHDFTKMFGRHLGVKDVVDRLDQPEKVVGYVELGCRGADLGPDRDVIEVEIDNRAEVATEGGSFAFCEPPSFSGDVVREAVPIFCRCEDHDFLDPLAHYELDVVVVFVRPRVAHRVSP